jgi:Tol biopolymer transport system component
LLLEITCPNDNTTWFYLGSTNGALIKLLNYPLLSISFGQDSLGWSPDGQYIIFSSDLDSIGNLDIYVLNVEAALKDPSMRPVRITTSGFYESSPDWQPRP